MNFLNFLIISFTVVNHSITIAWNIESLIGYYKNENPECANIFEADKEFFNRLGHDELFIPFHIHKKLCITPFKR